MLEDADATSCLFRSTMVSRIDVIRWLVLPVLAVLLVADAYAAPVIASSPASLHQLESEVTAPAGTGESIEAEAADASRDALSSSHLLGAVTIVWAAAMLVLLLRRRCWGLSPKTGPDWPLRPEALLFGWIVFLLGGAASAILAARLEQASWGPLQSQAVTMLVAYGVQFAIIGVLVSRLVQARRRARTAGEPAPRVEGTLPAIRLAVLGCLVVFPIILSTGMAVGWVQAQLTSVEPEAVGHATLKALQEAPGDRWGLLIMLLVTLGAPVVEEFAYRGLVQQGFRRLGGNPAGAIVLTSALFVFMHIPVIPGASIASAVVTLLGLSCFLGWLFERTGRLAAPIVAHALFNLLNLLLSQFIA